MEQMGINTLMKCFSQMGTTTDEAVKAMDALSNRLTAATNIGDVMFVDKISSSIDGATSYIQSKTEVLENRIQELENQVKDLQDQINNIMVLLGPVLDERAENPNQKGLLEIFDQITPSQDFPYLEDPNMFLY